MSKASSKTRRMFMPNVTLDLVESETGPDYTAYRYHLDNPKGGWLTGIRNMALGPLWFPRFGHASYDLHDSSTVLKLDSFKSMSPEDIMAVFGSPIPAFPTEVVALIDYINPHLKDDGTDSATDSGNPDWGDDVSEVSPGPTLPYMQVSVDYLLRSSVDFSTAIYAGSSTKWHRDDCGHLFMLDGDTITLAAITSGIQTDGTIISTTYKRHVAGAQVIKGTPDVIGSDQSITLFLGSSGSVSVGVEVVVTAEVGPGGTQVATESGSRTSTYLFEVVTAVEA